MPNISIMTPELNASVIRPAVHDIINQLKEITNIPKDTKILFMDYLNVSYQNGSTMSQQNSDNRDSASFGFTDQLAIDVDVTYNEGNISSTAIRRAEQIPIFNDNKLGVILKPIYSKTDVTVNIRYRSSSPNEGKKWRDAIRMHISNMRDMNLHTVSYHFGIPNEFINILKEIHKLRENVDGYGEDLDTYLSAHSTTRFTTVSNQIGTQKQLAIAEKQMQVVGLFDFEISPEKGEIDDAGSAWITSFSYKFSFDVPIATNMRYPIMIHNQVLDYPYINYEEKAYDVDKVDKARSESSDAFSYFDASTMVERYNDATKIINIPDYDEFHYTNVLKGTVPLLSVLCSVDVDTPRLLLSLKELGDYGIDSDILEFLEEEYFYITKPYKSIIFVNMYKFSGQVPDREIMVDSNLNVLSRDRDLSLRVNHRVMLSIVKDLTYLDREALSRLKRHRKAAVKLLTALNVNRGVLNSIAHHVNFNPLFPNLDNTGMSLERLQMQYIQMNTVNTSMVLAYKSVDIETLNSYNLRKP